MAPAIILNFQNFKFLPAHTLEWPICVILPYFIKIGQSIAEIWQIFLFFKMAAVRYLGFVVSVFGPPMISTWWSLSLCENGLNRCAGFDNLQVLWLCALGLKTPIHANKIGVLRTFPWIKKVHLKNQNMWSQNVIFPLLFLFAFTTACTTAQEVITRSDGDTTAGWPLIGTCVWAFDCY